MNKNKEIVKYIQSQAKKGFYPTHDEISEKFHTNLEGSIRTLYKLARVEYKRDPNPFLRYKKEERLAGIIKKLFPKLGYKIKNISIGPSKPSGADIIIEGPKKRLIPIEIKAYQKFGKLGYAKYSPYLRNEIPQLKQYIKNLHAPYGYLITSTDQKLFKTTPSNIKILFGKDLKNLLTHFRMNNELKNLDWIRNSSISYGKEEIYKKIRKEILEYVKEKLKESKYVSRQGIFKKFNVNPNSYFSGGTTGIYKKLNINPELISNYRMSRNFDKKKFKKRIIDFVKEEIKKGRFPTYKEIQRKFNCLPKLYFVGGIREIAKLAGIKYNRKFAIKTPREKDLIRQKIIKYTKEKLQKGYRPGYRDFRKDLLIGPFNYFNSIKEIYQKAGILIQEKRYKNPEKVFVKFPIEKKSKPKEG